MTPKIKAIAINAGIVLGGIVVVLSLVALGSC
jgi:hypothetical protein